jgi:transcriptional regulator with XRE-family HTH domain
MARRSGDLTQDSDLQGSVGALIRDIRKRREMTLEKLSELTGISVSSLSRIENTRLGMTVEKLGVLARALDVPPETLLSRIPKSGALAEARRAPFRFMIDRARERQSNFDRELSIEYLFDREADRSLYCFHVAIQAISIWDSEFVRHPGEKIVYVLSGAAIFYCEKQSPAILETSDSLYLDANVWHSIVATNERPAELLVTYYHGGVADPPFETQMFTPERWSELQSA